MRLKNFYDTGMRNFAVRHFGRYSMLSEMGFVFQNLIYHLLSEKTQRDGGTIHFWRTKDKAEVDFVIDRGDDVLPVEVKCREMKGKEIGCSLRGFISRYNPAEAWIVNIALNDEEKINKTTVRFIPFSELL